jgi:hypothetical protein
MAPGNVWLSLTAETDRQLTCMCDTEISLTLGKLLPLSETGLFIHKVWRGGIPALSTRKVLWWHVLTTAHSYVEVLTPRITVSDFTCK